MTASRSAFRIIVRFGCFLIAAASLFAVGATAEEPPVGPMPPLPDDVHAAAALEPATFEPPAASRSSEAGPLPLSSQPATGPAVKPAPARPLGDWTVLVAIAAAFALLAVLRLRSFRRTRPLPPDVFELLGEGSLGGQHAVRVVRFGPRTLLVAVSGAGCQTLAELDDPQATERIVAACQGQRLPSRPVQRPVPRAGVPAPLPAGQEVA